MTVIAFRCAACGARRELDSPVSGAIPACACGGALRPGGEVVFACTACRVRSRPAAIDPAAARPCPKCSRPLTVAAVLEPTPTAVPTVAAAPTLATADPALPRLNASGLLPGDRFGRYEIERELARGGMGIVYVARDPTLKRRVALKVMIAGEDADPDSIRRFVREARAAGQLRHPNIIAVHDAGEIDGKHYFTMDLVDGRELGELPGEGVALRELVGIVRLVAQALHLAHRHGVVHRDLKPANIMVEKNGRPLVMDFGLAKDVSGNASFRSMSGMVAGTPAYMSPEQAQGRTAEVDHRTDVYACGVILYELATGRRPFGGDSMYDTIRAVVSDEPEPPARLAVECDARLEAIILRCLEKDKARRYPDAEALAGDLGRWLEGGAVEARSTGGAERAWRRLRRRPGLLAGLAAGAAVVLAGLIVVLVITLSDSELDRAARDYAAGGERAHAALVLLASRLAEGALPPYERTRALELLRLATADGDPGREAVAGRALAAAQAGAPAPVLAVVALDEGASVERRRQALTALAELGPRAEGAEALAGRLASACRTAAVALVPALAGAALKLDPPGAVEPLSALAADAGQSKARRLAALTALGEGNPATHGAPMQRLLRLAGDQDEEIGAAAEALLARVRSREAVFGQFGLAARGGDAAVAAAGAQRAVAANQRKLMELAFEDEDGNPVAAPGEKPAEKPVEKPVDPAVALAKGLADPDAGKRATCVWDLGRLGTPAAVAALAGVLGDGDAEVRRLARRALAALAAEGNAEAKAALAAKPAP